MNRGALLNLSFATGLIFSMVGAWQTITRAPGAGSWMAAALFFALVFIATALYEIFSSRRIERAEKLLWTMGFLFLSCITGLFYLLSERKRIKARA